MMRPWPKSIRRVVFVATEFPTLAGGSVYIESMGQAFQERGLHVEVLSLYPGEGATALAHRYVFPRRDLYKAPALAGRRGAARVRAVPRWAFKRLTVAPLGRRAARRLQRLSPDTLVVFTHVTALDVLCNHGYDSSSARALLIGQHHSSYSMFVDESYLMETARRVFASMDFFTALSAEDATQFQEYLGVPAVAMPNPRRPLPTKADGAQGRARRLVALARYGGEKRLDLMVDLVDRVFADTRADGWTLHLYGAGNAEETIAAHIAKARHGDRMRLEGPTTDPLGVLATSGVHLVTSSFEGFSLSTLEAASMGVPTVAFDVSPGLRGLMEAVDGVLVPADDGQAYVDAVVALVADDEMRTRRGERAVLGSQRFDGPVIVDRWADVLAPLAAHRPSS